MNTDRPPRRRRFGLPVIERHDELPQWIIASDVGAYYPHGRTIFLQTDADASTLIHELGHWLLHQLCLPVWCQHEYDRLYLRWRAPAVAGRLAPQRTGAQ